MLNMDIKYEINITENAVKDLNNIYFYIADDLLESESAANLITKLKEVIFSLEVMPSRYSLVNDSLLAEMGCRHINVKKYIILYLIDEKTKTVNIMRIIHGRMDYAKYI